MGSHPSQGVYLVLRRSVRTPHVIVDPDDYVAFDLELGTVTSLLMGGIEDDDLWTRIG